MTESSASTRPAPRWQDLAFWGACLALLGVGLWLRLNHLVVGLGNANYDEGVYWQTLRSIAAGHPLYDPTFFSQPPFFMQVTYLPFVMLGHTLWAARFAVVLVSLLGLLGAMLLGYALAGRVGAVAGLLLLVGSAPYLAASRELMAECPCVALGMLAVGLAYVWWRHPDGRRGSLFAAIAAAALVLSIMSKLYGLAAGVPIAMLAAARLWQVFHLPAEERVKSGASLLWGVAAAVATTALVLAPYLGSWHALWQGMVSFHLAARGIRTTEHHKAAIILEAIKTPLALVALLGTVVALLRREWLVLPLVAWLLASLYLLWNQVPLFPEHTVILVAPLVALATAVVLPLAGWFQLGRAWQVVAVAAVVLVAVAAVLGARSVQTYLRADQASNTVGPNIVPEQLVSDLHAYVPADRFVVTDAQPQVAAADRSTPPDLVDTSFVRLSTGYLTSRQLIDAASQPQVSAVLLYSGRLAHYSSPRRTYSLAAFLAWVPKHLHLARDYGGGKTLWVKPAIP